MRRACSCDSCTVFGVSSGLFNVPEERRTVEDAADVLLEDGGEEVLAEGDIGNVDQRLFLELGGEGLLSGEVGGVEPLLAEGFEFLAFGPAEHAAVADSAKEGVADRGGLVEAGPERAENVPAALGDRFLAGATLDDGAPV